MHLPSEHQILQHNQHARKGKSDVPHQPLGVVHILYQAHDQQQRDIYDVRGEEGKPKIAVTLRPEAGYREQHLAPRQHLLVVKRLQPHGFFRRESRFGRTRENRSSESSRLGMRSPDALFAFAIINGSYRTFSACAHGRDRRRQVGNRGISCSATTIGREIGMAKRPNLRRKEKTSHPLVTPAPESISRFLLTHNHTFPWWRSRERHRVKFRRRRELLTRLEHVGNLERRR